jgi:hypothetical protein
VQPSRIVGCRPRCGTQFPHNGLAVHIVELTAQYGDEARAAGRSRYRSGALAAEELPRRRRGTETVRFLRFGAHDRAGRRRDCCGGIEAPRFTSCCGGTEALRYTSCRGGDRSDCVFPVSLRRDRGAALSASRTADRSASLAMSRWGGTEALRFLRRGRRVRGALDWWGGGGEPGSGLSRTRSTGSRFGWLERGSGPLLWCGMWGGVVERAMRRRCCLPGLTVGSWRS